MINSLLDAALYHHEAGRPVIPVRKDKKPACPEWGKWQHTKQTEEEVRDLFSQPAYGLAPLTWPASDLAVLDFDGPHAGGAWKAQGIDLPETARSKTQSGGLHLIFRVPQHMENRAGLKRTIRLVKANGCGCAKFCGVDFLVDGYFIVAPTPGYHEDPEATLEHISPLPEEVLKLIAQQEKSNGSNRAHGDGDRFREGERNGALTSLAGKWRRVGMNFESIFAALKVVNEQKCDGPLDESEVEVIARSVSRYQPEEEKGNKTAQAADGFKSHSLPKLVLAPEGLYGLAGEIVNTLDPYTEADPVAVLSTLLAGIGNIIGRGPHFRVEYTNHYLKHFVGLVGETSKGRKGQSWSTPRYMFKQIDDDWVTKRVTSGLSSGEGLVFNVRDELIQRQPIKDKGRVIDYQDVITDEGVADKRLFVIEEELSQALKVMSREGNILSAIIRQAWDSGDLHPLTKNNPIKATAAHISIVGHITRDELLRHLDETERANGFANRFIWLLVARSKIIPNPRGVSTEVLSPLIERLRGVIDFAHTVEEMERDDGTERLWAEVYPELSEGKPGMVGAIISRGEAQVMRLACLYTLLDLSSVIRTEHLKAALALWDYAEKSARLIFGEKMGDPIADRIMFELRARGGMTETEIRDLFGRHQSAGIDRALDLLVRLGIAVAETFQTKGRPRTVWRMAT